MQMQTQLTWHHRRRSVRHHCQHLPPINPSINILAKGATDREVGFVDRTESPHTSCRWYANVYVKGGESALFPTLREAKEWVEKQARARK